jgi:hypothetical protein
MSSLYDIPADSFTAQLVVSEREAYVALSRERCPVGPNGEPRVAVLLHTVDGGEVWKELPWRRTFLSRLLYPGFPNWPPEAVMAIAVEGDSVIIVHRDEHVIFEPGGESLWESVFHGVTWSVRKIRRMDYEGTDSSAAIRQITLGLPHTIRPPDPLAQGKVANDIN